MCILNKLWYNNGMYINKNFIIIRNGNDFIKLDVLLNVLVFCVVWWFINKWMIKNVFIGIIFNNEWICFR